MSSTPTTFQKLPILENGDRVTRAEFERYYHQMPNVKKAELIEGVVYIPSTVSRCCMYSIKELVPRNIKPLLSS